MCPLHWYFDADHLSRVLSEMERLGPPSLRGYFDEETNAFLLREGTHRIRAAAGRGLVPTLHRVPWWRSRKSLDRARYAARERGLYFPRVVLV